MDDDAPPQGMTIRLGHLHLLYGDAGAQEAFQHLVAALIAVIHPGAAGIRVQRGDGGVDAYVGNWASGGDVHVFQVKYFPGQVGPAQKDQIRRSFAAATNNSRFRLQRWTLCIPIDLSQDEATWFTEWARTGDRAGIVEIPLWGQTQIEALLSLEATRGIRDRFLADDLRRQVTEIHRSVVRSKPVNRVLIGYVPGYRMFRGRDGAGIVRDLGLVPIVFEELIAHGVTRIAVRARSFEHDVARNLPGLTRELIDVLDDSPAGWAADELLTPVLRELRLDIHAGDHSFRGVPHVPNEIFMATVSLLPGVATMLLAIDNELNLEFDPDSLRGSASTLRHYCRSPDAIAVLALLEGFFARYRNVRITSMSPRPNAQIDLRALLADTEYRELASSSKLLGEPERVALGLGRVAELAARLVERSRHELMIDHRQLGVTHERILDPRSSIGRQLTEGFQPPRLSIKEVQRAALRVYKLRNPPPLLPMGSDPDIIELGDELLVGSASSSEVGQWLRTKSEQRVTHGAPNRKRH